MAVLGDYRNAAVCKELLILGWMLFMTEQKMVLIGMTSNCYQYKKKVYKSVGRLKSCESILLTMRHNKMYNKELNSLCHTFKSNKLDEMWENCVTPVSTRVNLISVIYINLWSNNLHFIYSWSHYSHFQIKIQNHSQR